MKPRRLHLAVLFLGCAGWAPWSLADGDGHEHEHEHDADAREGAGEAVVFRADRGLQLPAGVAEALGLRTATAAMRPLTPALALTGQVFATAPRGLALARVPAATAESLRLVAFAGATLRSIDRSAAAEKRLADVVFEIEGVHAVGDFVVLTAAAAPAPCLSVPRAAILDSAGGTFVYVARDGFFRRTAVSPGRQSAELVEITAGLRAGDVVVAAPVDQLWLAELRLTKGGGHSH